MEVFLAILVVLAFFGALILGVVGFFIGVRSAKRLTQIEKNLSSLQEPIGPQATTKPAPAAAPPESAPKTPPLKKPTSPASGPWEKSAAATQAAAMKSEAPTGPAHKPTPPKDTTPPFFARLVDNFKTNWVIWIAGLSLAMGGLFIVQYGLEQGLLGPVARVIVSLIFGTALLAGAEFIRRQDASQRGFFTVPAALAAGGIGTLFAAVVSAHILYDLTGVLIGFLSMALVSWLALAAGLIYGPVLAVIGLLGAFLSPILVASTVPPPASMYLYFLAVLTAALFVERMQRWIWLSALAVSLALFQGIVLNFAQPLMPVLAAYLAAIMVVVTALPAFGAPPVWHDNTMVRFKSLLSLSKEYPTVLTVTTALAVTVILFLSNQDDLAHWQVAIFGFTALLVAATFLNSRAQNLDQIPVLFAFGLMGTVISGPLLFIAHTQIQIAGETVSGLRPYFSYAAFGTAATILTFLIAAIWRTNRSVRPNYWIWLAAFAPLISLPFFWACWHSINPLGNGGWAYIGLMMAAVQTGMAMLLHRQRKEFPLGADAFCASVLVLLLMVAVELFDGISLSFAVVLLALAAVFFEVRFGFVTVGRLLVALVALIMGRLTLFPGVDWALDAMWSDFAILYIGATLLFAAGARHAQKFERAASFLVFETATLATIAITLSIAAVKLISAQSTPSDLLMAGLIGFVWGTLALVQLRRMALFGVFQLVRKILASLYMAIFVLMLFINLTDSNPLIYGSIQGPWLFDSLAVAYVLPALIALAALRIPSRFAFLQARWLVPAAAALLAFYGALEIRRFWHGSDISGGHITTEELYSYTIALLVITVATFFASIARNSKALRTIALTLAGVTALKVFLWDMSGLQGLGRATAFIGLGLTLAAIAWLHQKFQIATHEQDQK